MNMVWFKKKKGDTLKYTFCEFRAILKTYARFLRQLFCDLIHG